MASRMGNVEVVRELIKAGADISQGDNRGRTPLFMASLYGRVDTLRELLQAGALEANPANTFKVVRGAIEGKNVDVIKMIVKRLNEDDKLRKAVPDKDAIQNELVRFAEYTNNDELLDYLVSVGIFSKGMRKLREKDRQKKTMAEAVPKKIPTEVVREIAKFMGGRRRKTMRKRKTKRKR
jgi:ankyrin repeat protein